MIRSRITLVVLMCALSGGSVTACRSGSPFEQDVPDKGVRLVVKNDNIYEMDIYAVADGVATRIGTVSGVATKGFSLDQTFYSAGDFRIVATPFGGNGRASSGPIVVHEGQTVQFTIRTSLRASSVQIQ